MEVRMTQTAKIFMNGRSQAVRLPADFRFEGSEVFIRKDDQTGDIILSERVAPSNDWSNFLRLRDEAMQAGEIDDTFLSSGERDQGPARGDPFEDRS
jgi:antitoxin VapB